MFEQAPERRRDGALVLEGVPAVQARIIAGLRSYQNARLALLRGWHPSGEGVLVATRFGDTSQIHWVHRPGGARRQMTFAAEPIGAAVVPAGSDPPLLIMTRDEGGSERYQIFIHDLATGFEQRWTDGLARYAAPTPSPDGQRLAYLTTARNGRDWDVCVRDLDGDGKTQPVTNETGSWIPEDWSPDGSALIVSRYASVRDNRLFLADLLSRTCRPLAATEQVSYAGNARFSADGKRIYFVSDADAEVRRLCRLDLATGDLMPLVEYPRWDGSGGPSSIAPPQWGVSQVAPSPDGRFLAYVINEDGYGVLCLRSMPGERERALPEMLRHGIASDLHWSPGGGHLGFTLHTATSPADVFSLSMADGSVTRWTHSEAGGLSPDRFTAPELIGYPTFDTVESPTGVVPRQIPAWYYRGPDEPGQQDPRPVVIAIHGGPESQARPTFQPLIQYWVQEMGLAVLQPNVRGSAGYGKRYLQLDDGRLREDSVRDIGALLDWIATQPDLDASRVAVYGGSYGGYMVLASMIHYGDRLCGGIDLVGISNFITFLENTGDYRRDLRRVEYGDERDPEMRAFLEAISPTTRANEITKPLLVAQGRNDPRVPVTEAEQIFAAVKANGGAPWYFLANDEGHGFQKKRNRDVFDQVVVMFLERVLLDV